MLNKYNTYKEIQLSSTEITKLHKVPDWAEDVTASAADGSGERQPSDWVHRISKWVLLGAKFKF